MTRTITTYTTQDGRTVELRSDPTYGHLVHVNGVIQDPSSYRVIGKSVFFGDERPKWESWYAWRPVRIKGKWHWLAQVYRRKTNTYVNHDDWARYEYGDDFDLLRGIK